LAITALSKKSDVNLSVYNILGQNVKELLKETSDRGTYQIKWNGKDYANSNIATGVYLISLTIIEENNVKLSKVIKTLILK